MPNWLARTIICVVGTSAILAVISWASCTFYVGPQLFQLYVRTDGRLPTRTPDSCRAPSEHAQTTLSGLLATLLALRQSPPER